MRRHQRRVDVDTQRSRRRIGDRGGHGAGPPRRRPRGAASIVDACHGQLVAGQIGDASPRRGVRRDLAQQAGLAAQHLDGRKVALRYELGTAAGVTSAGNA
jgi:hypothetical protein